MPGTTDADEAALLAELRQGRESLKDLFVTEAELQFAKRHGREKDAECLGPEGNRDSDTKETSPQPSP